MDRGVLQKIYLSNLPSLRRFIARYFARQEDIEDVLQETYARAADSKTEQINSPKSYLFQIARNIALNELNRKSNKVTDYIGDLVNPELDNDDVSIEAQVHDRLKMETFSSAVDELPDQCRRVFLLRKIYGLTHKEIARQLDISVSTVEKHLAKGLLRCSQNMNKKGYNTKKGLKVVKTAES